MKKYFVKYLPVEGEIKEGDRVAWDELNNLVVGITGSKNCINLVKDDNYKAAKLFLCSRDIQVGDRFRHYHVDPKRSVEERKPIFDFTNLAKEEDICDRVEDGKVWWSRDSQYLKERANYAISTEAAFKVIGEISPEAKWVKEGDEFNKEDFSYQKVCHDTPGNMGCCFHCSRSKGCDSTDYIVYIKCPCCETFK